MTEKMPFTRTVTDRSSGRRADSAVATTVACVRATVCARVQFAWLRGRSACPRPRRSSLLLPRPLTPTPLSQVHTGNHWPVPMVPRATGMATGSHSAPSPSCASKPASPYLL